MGQKLEQSQPCMPFSDNTMVNTNAHGDMDPTDTVIYGPSTANQVSLHVVSVLSNTKETFEDGQIEK